MTMNSSVLKIFYYKNQYILIEQSLHYVILYNCTNVAHLLINNLISITNLLLSIM